MQTMKSILCMTVVCISILVAPVHAKDTPLVDGKLWAQLPQDNKSGDTLTYKCTTDTRTATLLYGLGRNSCDFVISSDPAEIVPQGTTLTGKDETSGKQFTIVQCGKGDTITFTFSCAESPTGPNNLYALATALSTTLGVDGRVDFNQKDRSGVLYNVDKTNGPGYVYWKPNKFLDWTDTWWVSGTTETGALQWTKDKASNTIIDANRMRYCPADQPTDNTSRFVFTVTTSDSYYATYMPAVEANGITADGTVTTIKNYLKMFPLANGMAAFSTRGSNFDSVSVYRDCKAFAANDYTTFQSTPWTANVPAIFPVGASFAYALFKSPQGNELQVTGVAEVKGGDCKGNALSLPTGECECPTLYVTTPDNDCTTYNTSMVIDVDFEVAVPTVTVDLTAFDTRRVPVYRVNITKAGPSHLSIGLHYTQSDDKPNPFKLQNALAIKMGGLPNVLADVTPTDGEDYDEIVNAEPLEADQSALYCNTLLNGELFISFAAAVGVTYTVLFRAVTTGTTDSPLYTMSDFKPLNLTLEGDNKQSNVYVCMDVPPETNSMFTFESCVATNDHVVKVQVDKTAWSSTVQSQQSPLVLVNGQIAALHALKSRRLLHLQLSTNGPAGSQVEVKATQLATATTDMKWPIDLRDIDAVVTSEGHLTATKTASEYSVYTYTDRIFDAPPNSKQVIKIIQAQSEAEMNALALALASPCAAQSYANGDRAKDVTVFKPLPIDLQTVGHYVVFGYVIAPDGQAAAYDTLIIETKGKDQPPTAPTPSAPSDGHNKDKDKKKIGIAVGVSVGVVVLIAAAAAYVFVSRRRRQTYDTVN